MDRVQTNNPQSTDEAKLRSLVASLKMYWNEGDANGYASLFAENADYVAPNGTHYQGRRAIEKSHQEIFTTFFKGSRLEGKMTKLRFLTPEIAIIHRVGHILLPEDSEEKNSSIQTLVAVKRQDTWHFAAFQNTDVQSYP